MQPASQAKLLHGYALTQEQRQLLRDMALVVADGRPGRSLDKQFAQEEAPSWPSQVLTPGLEPMGEAALPPLPVLGLCQRFWGIGHGHWGVCDPTGPRGKDPYALVQYPDQRQLWRPGKRIRRRLYLWEE